MAIENQNYVPLNQVIGQAITAFDNIYDAIADKGVPGYNKGGQGSAPSGYAGDITSYLFRIKNAQRSDVLVDQLENYSGSQQNHTATLTATSVTYGDSNSVTLTASGLPKGYYDTGSVININKTGTPVSVSGDLTGAGSGFTLSGSTYTYALSGKIASSISVSKATLSVAPTNITVSNDAEISSGELTLTPATAGMTGFINSEDYDELESAVKATYYDIGVASSLAADGSITPVLTATLSTPGYVSKTADVTLNNNVSTPLGSSAGGLNLTGALDTHIYVKQATIDMGSPTGGALSLTDNDAQLGSSSIASGQENNYYDIHASVTGASFPNAQVTQGYTMGQSLGSQLTINGGDAHLYIRKAVIPTSTQKDMQVTASTEDADIIASGGVHYDNSDKVVITAAANTTATTLSITPGYTKLTSAQVTYTGGTDTISLRTAAGKLKATNVAAALTGTPLVSAMASETQASDYYTVTSAITGTLSIDSEDSTTHKGFLKNYNSFAGTISDAGATYYIKKGVDQNGTFGTPTSVENNNGTLTYTVQATHITPLGYYEANSTKTWTTTITVPAATLRWEEGEDGEEGHLVVSSGGYLTAGKTIGFGGSAYEDTGSESLATVKATLSSSIISTTSSANAYEITIAKDSSTDAGYISSSKGAIAFANNAHYYIAHGQYHQTITSDLNFGSVTWDSTAGKFKISATPTISAPSGSITRTSGYIDVTDSNDISVTATANPAKSTQLATGELGVSVGTLSVTKDAAASNVITDNNSNRYIVIDVSGTAAPTVTRAGYVGTSAGQFDSSAVSNNITANDVTFGIKEGSVSNANIGGSITASFDPDTRVVSIDNSRLTITGTITEGYVSGGNITKGTNNPTVTGLTIREATAAITVNGSETNVTGQNGLKLYTAGQVGANTSNYYSITPSAKIDAAITVSQSGWISDSSSITPLSDVAATTNVAKYIAKFALSSANSTATYTRDGAQSSETVWALTIGDTSNPGQLFIDTKDKYSQNGILVDLDDDAAGANVQAALTQLQSRLAGELARPGAGA